MHIDIGTQESQYEFNVGQDETIRGLASAMKFVAVVEMVLGILLACGAVIAALVGQLATCLGYAVQAVVMIVLAARQSSAADAFRSIVDTRGSDISHLMGALENLRSYFHIKRTLYIIAICLFTAALLLAVMMVGTRSS
jgi:hypothetical protein